jgi:hypothetical protein
MGEAQCKKSRGMILSINLILSVTLSNDGDYSTSVAEHWFSLAWDPLSQMSQPAFSSSRVTWLQVSDIDSGMKQLRSYITLAHPRASRSVCAVVRRQYSGLKVFTFDRGPVWFEVACSAKIKVQNAGKRRVRFLNTGCTQSHVIVFGLVTSSADHSGPRGLTHPTWGMDVCVRLFCVCSVLCAGRGLATGWSPVQGDLQTV